MKSKPTNHFAETLLPVHSAYNSYILKYELSKVLNIEKVEVEYWKGNYT